MSGNDQSDPRIGILVVAYNAEQTLRATLDRVPAGFRDRIAEVIVLDDASHDDTFAHGLAWAERPDTPSTLVLRHTKNLGYGGNQKAAYKLALERGLDIVVLLHGDGQYAPELLPEMVAPLVRGECDAVMGSRMMSSGAARRGGMPLYKLVGNRILTMAENAMLGTRLTEFHSGYRAYTASALRDIPFENNTDDFDFDTQIIVQLIDAGKRILEIPIPTYYGDEICYVNGMRYAKDVIRDVLEYRLVAKGFGTSPWVPKAPDYAFKDGDGSSHAVILEMMAGLPESRVLDLGCSGGLLAAHARAAGHHVTGVDFLEIPGVRERTDRFIQASLEDGIPAEAGDGYDVIVAADVIEHLSRSGDALRDMRRVLRPGGQVLLSVPNFAHWYPRIRTTLGLFGYDRRGILDETHLRFFTRATLRRLVRASGFDIVEERTTGLPLGSISEADGRKLRMLRKTDKALVRARPTLFGYQYVLRLTPHARETVHVEVI
jgi:glycosyltransferase involved in cell wall biosynthesis/ubiquinone/menaquinone biosynthesis C-methylase UbiE